MAAITSTLRILYISIIALVASYALYTEPEARSFASSALSILFKAVGYTTFFFCLTILWIVWGICNLLAIIVCEIAGGLWSIISSIVYYTLSTAYTLLTTRTIIDFIDLEWLSLAGPAVAIPLCWIWLDYKFSVPVDIRERFDAMTEQAREIKFPFWSECILSQSEQEKWDRGCCSALPEHVYPWSMGEVERVMLAKEEQLELVPVLQERITAYDQRKQERESEIARAEMAKTPSGRLTLALSASNRNRHLRKSASTSSSSSSPTSSSNEPSPSASPSPPCTTPETSPEINQPQKSFSKSFAPYNLADLKFIEAQRQSLALSQARKPLPSQRTSVKVFALPTPAAATRVTNHVTTAPSPSPARAPRSSIRPFAVACKAAASSNALNVAEESNASATPVPTPAAVGIPSPTPVGIVPFVQPISIPLEHPAVQNVLSVPSESFEAFPPLQLYSAPSAIHLTAVPSFTVADLFPVYPVINTAFVNAAIIRDYEVPCVRKSTTRHPKKPLIKSSAAVKLVHARPSVVRGIRNPCLRPTTEKHWASYAVEEDVTSVLRRSMVARRSKTMMRYSLLRGVSRVMYVGDWDESIHMRRKITSMFEPRPQNGFAFAFTFAVAFGVASALIPQELAPIVQCEPVVPITIDPYLQATSLDDFLAAYTPPSASGFQPVPLAVPAVVVSSPAPPQAAPVVPAVPAPVVSSPVTLSSSSLPPSSTWTKVEPIKPPSVQAPAPPTPRTIESSAATATAPKPFFLALLRKSSPLRNSTVAAESTKRVESDAAMLPPATLPPPKATSSSSGSLRINLLTKTLRVVPSGTFSTTTMPPPALPSYAASSKGKGVDPAEGSGGIQMPTSSTSASLGGMAGPAIWQGKTLRSSYDPPFLRSSSPPPTQAELDSKKQEEEDDMNQWEGSSNSSDDAEGESDPEFASPQPASAPSQDAPNVAASGARRNIRALPRRR